MVSAWGAYTGPPGKLRRADSLNPAGYFEHLPIWDCLEFLGTRWWDRGFQEKLREKAGIPEIRRKAVALVSEMEKGAKPWLWKDPALSFFLPFWDEILGNPVYIVAVRNPLDVARSWQRFILPPDPPDSVRLVSANLLRWHYIMSIILQHMGEASSHIYVSYEDVQTDPEGQAARLANFLQEECDRVADSLPAMVQSVRPDLWRFRSDGSLKDVEEASGELEMLYQLVRARVAGDRSPFRPSDYPLPSGWRDTITTSEILARKLREEAGPTDT